MITTVRKNEKNARDIAARIYGELPAKQLNELAEALVVANPHLRVRGRVAEGTMLVVPTGPKSLRVAAEDKETPTGEILERAGKAIGGYLDALSAAIELARKQDEQTAEQLKIPEVARLRSSQVLKPHFAKVDEGLKQHAKELDALAKATKEMGNQAKENLKELSDQLGRR